MSSRTCWLDVIEYEEADSNLRAIYDGVRSPAGQLDNLYKAFSLRPHTIGPADALYLAALHHTDNTLPKWFSELIGTYVAILTGCGYARAHHGQNFIHLYSDKQQANEILNNLVADNPDCCMGEKEVRALKYTKKLCQTPDAVTEDDVAALKASGWSDGEVLEIIQVVAMFSYFIRVINGAGIALDGEKVGLYQAGSLPG